MSDSIKESQVVLTVQAIRINPKLTVFKISQLYNVLRSTFRDRFDSKCVRRDNMPNSRKLNNIEEECILHYILEVIDQGYPSRFEDV
jgi:hypothetical protein